MNNGEGTRENLSDVASPDPFDPFLSKSDGGGDALSPLSLSRYSSCGESEFERYCSANSVMGTPSMHSSFGASFNDCLDSEFESSRSLGFGDDVSFENFSLGGNRRLSLGDGRIEFCQGRNDEDAKVENGFSGLQLYDDNDNEGRHDDEGMKMGMVSDDKRALGGSVSNLSIQGIGERSLVGDGIGNGSGIKPEVKECSLLCGDNQGKDNGLEGLDLQLCGEFEGREMEGEEDGTSSRYEHSEGEDSMYNYGSDDEHRVNSYYPRNVEYVQQSKCENENPLIMNSHVAFGSEDWDDFEQEVGGNNPSSLTLDKLQYKRELNLEGERKLQNFSSLTPIRFPSDSQKEQRNDVTELPVLSKEVQGTDETKENINHSMANLTGFPCSGELEHVEEVKDVPVANYQVQGADILVEEAKTSFPTSTGFPRSSVSEQDVIDIPVTSHQAQGSMDMKMHFYNSSVSDVFEMEQNPQVEKALFKIGLDTINSATERNHQHANTKDVISNGGCGENQEFEYFIAGLDPLADVSIDQHCPDSTASPKELYSEFLENRETKVSPSKLGNIMIASKSPPASADLFKDHPAVDKRENLELNDFYDEVVHEMEEILLDYTESPGVRFSQGNQMLQSHLSPSLRDGGSTASISGTDDAYPLTPLLHRIDGVEVVGAKQKKGDVSLSERLVGVKEYTVYRIRVWSGKDQWEVERRYRDFFTLYRRLKSLFTDQGWILPSPWSTVEKESRKIFGNSSPDVVAERSVLIQESLRSILHSTYFSSPPGALIWFLSPQESLPSSPASNMLVDQSKSFTRRADEEKFSSLGKTISLIVEVRPYKSIKQMLEAQHYTCAGCHRHFDDGMTLMQDLVQTFGWGKPRLCEYTGQLFCSSCHTSETAVLPARVLHHWDFTHYPVSQLAKSYLDSVHDQPMLCVSAVNPFLFSKVPALQQVMGLRKKIGSMLPHVRCPFRRSVYKGLGSRRYLLESNDFFSLRDLIDLSKGPFAALPVMVENVSRKILEHITEQCLICCDVGVPCCARQACNDPSSLIFTFQEGEVEKCKSCEAVFHKPCFRKLTYCPCGATLGVSEAVNSTKSESHNANSGANRSLTLLGSRSGSGLSIGLLSGLFSKAKPEKAEHKDNDTVILMGSLPSTSL
ncbi:hypothetical protein Q3G72_014662 [Acer saccharum]|nr:hypothetical protein Q3G72_014662 [Acer saccharum]